eukprot:scaffold67951_cov46-Prasinocladus_malaysianus.AAC.1
MQIGIDHDKRLKDLLRVRMLSQLPRGPDSRLANLTRIPGTFKKFSLAEGEAVVKEYDRQNGTSWGDRYTPSELKQFWR